MLDVWVDGMKLATCLLGAGVFFCVLGMIGTERPSERRSAARITMVLLMSFALVPVWPLVAVSGLGYGLVKLVKTADFATLTEELERKRA